MEDFNEYYAEFKNYSIEDKRYVTIEQLKELDHQIAAMCDEIRADREVIDTKCIKESDEQVSPELEYIGNVLVYATSMSLSLFAFIDRFTEILKKRFGSMIDE